MEDYIARLVVSLLIGAILGGIGCSIKDRSEPLFLTSIFGIVWAMCLGLLGFAALVLWLFERTDLVVYVTGGLLDSPHIIWFLFSFWTGIAVVFWGDYFRSTR